MTAPILPFPALEGWSLRGLDCSNFQDPKVLAAPAGIDFLIARCCYGTSPDARFAAHVAAARAKGIKIAPYAFLRHNVKDYPAEAQAIAINAVLTANNWGANASDGIVWLDLEANPENDGTLNTTTALALYRQVMAILAPRWPLGLYLSPDFFRLLGSPTDFAKLPIWLCQWGAPSASRPERLPLNPVIWQFGLEKTSRWDGNIARAFPTFPAAAPALDPLAEADKALTAAQASVAAAREALARARASTRNPSA